MTISLKKLTAAMALGGCVALTSGVANAATDGTPGASSSGQVPISVTIPALIQVSGLTDIVFNFVAGGAAQNMSFCVKGNVAGTYTMTLSSVAESAFQLDNAGAKLSYTAQFDGDTDATNGTVMTHGAASAVFASSGGFGPCALIDHNAALNISVSDLEAAGVAAGTYTDTLTLLVTAQ